jgi:hypothetical protein
MLGAETNFEHAASVIKTVHTAGGRVLVLEVCCDVLHVRVAQVGTGTVLVKSIAEVSQSEGDLDYTMHSNCFWRSDPDMAVG